MAGLARLVFALTLFHISSVTCVGTASIENQCDVDVYVWSVANVPNNTASYLEPNIGTYNEAYRVNPDPNGGISLKIATVPDDSFITQFEYTYHPDNPRVYYDISNINGYPFETWGLYLSPSSGDCSTITCDPGVAICPEAYNQPNDNFAVQNCEVSADLTLTLCPPQTTSLEAATVTVTTTDSGGDATLTTLATTVTSVGPVTTSQGTLPETVTVDSESSSTTATTTNLEPVVVTLMTTDTAGDPTLTTLTTTITSVGPVVTSQDTASEIGTTDPATTSMITISSETILRASETTDAAGQLSLTTLTTVIAVTTLD
ncbi:hypothetical protein KCU88_g7487, partial [Aureobasidium melanogenum]